jgi:hypothetical protein
MSEYPNDEPLKIQIITDETGSQQLRVKESTRRFKQRCAVKLLRETHASHHMEIHRVLEHEGGEGVTIEYTKIQPDGQPDPPASCTYSKWQWAQTQKQLKSDEGDDETLIYGAKSHGE